MDTPDGLEITGPMHDRFEEILSPTRPGADRAAAPRARRPPRRSCWPPRRARDEELAAGGTLDFLEETRAIREDDSWRVAEPAPGLVDRRVEITGPTDRKMTINALNSGAKVWLADHEDANTPLWENVVDGQLNLRDSIDRRQLDFTSPEGKAYALKPTTSSLATIVVRPARLAPAREAHPRRRRADVAAAWSTSRSTWPPAASSRSTAATGPYFYLPKMESPPRGAAVERRLRPRPGLPRHPARHDPGDRADRDLPGGVRDGGDPLRAARPLRRAQRRPLGLHVQRHQELPHPRRATSCCPTATRSR